MRYVLDASVTLRGRLTQEWRRHATRSRVSRGRSAATACSASPRAGELDRDVIFHCPPHIVRVPDQPISDTSQILRYHPSEHDSHVFQLTPPEFDRRHLDHPAEMSPNPLYPHATGLVEKLLRLAPFLREYLRGRHGTDQNGPQFRRAVGEPEPHASPSGVRFELQGGEGSVHLLIIVYPVPFGGRVEIPAVHRGQNVRGRHATHRARTVDGEPRRHPSRLRWPNI